TNFGKSKFIGLPIPTTALILGSFYLSGIFNIGLALIIMTAVSLLMISTVEYTKIRNPILLFVGGLLIILACLPQEISSGIFNLPAKFLFMFTLIYLVAVPIMAYYAKLHRSGPNV
ncbi:MAG TPA: CDP-diacylglycerol--serine O-phosphatidyltransferase, partial [Methanobacterium sp.]|nr:CDP-diacylglycerol--serine O-phosphatidyltransferase [Methanobacterium sp.]